MSHKTTKRSIKMRVCSRCKEQKPIDRFMIKTIGYMKAFSDQCTACRHADDDDGGSGGKQRKLSVDQDTKQQMLLEQQEQQAINEHEKQTSREEFTQENNDNVIEKTVDDQGEHSTKEKKGSKSSEKTISNKDLESFSREMLNTFFRNFAGSLIHTSPFAANIFITGLALAGSISGLNLGRSDSVGQNISGKISSMWTAEKNNINPILEIVKNAFSKY